MKVAILCVLSLGVTWALPKGQNELQFKRLYVDPKTDKLPHDVISRIVNGQEAVPHSIPYQAYLIATSIFGDRWLCGGSLISPRHVLTAAHCLEGAFTASVYLGVHNMLDIEPTRVIVDSLALIPHRDYDETVIINDIGLIVLEETVQLNEYIDVVILPSREITSDYEGANARVSGWGIEFATGNTSPVLREVNSTVISNNQCRQIFNIVTDSQICISGEGGVGTCNGDSGGPLIVGNTQVGIASYGASGCLAGYPSGFTRITSYLDWLEEQTGLKF